MKPPAIDGVDSAIATHPASHASVKAGGSVSERVPTALSPESQTVGVGVLPARRLEAVIGQNADFVFRCLRRAGLDPASAEDGAQQVFMVVAQKLASIERGKERAFLYSTAKNIAARQRRSYARRSEIALTEESGDEAMPMSSDGPSLDELLDQQRARVLLDQILAAMPEKLSDVFVLSEIEELPAPEVAEILSIPPGTVASRLLRAREVFDQRLARIQKQRAFRSREGGGS